MRWLFFLLSITAIPAWAQVQIHDAWVRATVPGAKVAAGYMTMRNAGAAPDRLLAVSSAAAEKVETHVTMREGEVLRMREVKGYEIPAGGAFELKPGGAHLMFVNISAPFKEGASVPALLRFEKAGEVKVEFRVGRPAAPSHEHKGH